MKFFPYQSKVLNDPSQRIILEKSRRIGGTYCVAYWALQRMISKPGWDVIFTTKNSQVAGEFIRYVTHWGRIWNLKAQINGLTDLIIPESAFLKETVTIPHDNGMKPSRVIALSSNPNATAGFGGDLIIDEMALHVDAEKLMTVAAPVITGSQGKMIILSTHRSKGSLFNQYVQRAIADAKLPDDHPEKAGWSHHKVTIYDAIQQGFLEQFVNKNRIENNYDPYTEEEFINSIIHGECFGDMSRFEQEYCCIPSEINSTLIPWDQCLDAASDEIIEYNSNNPSYLGWDPATSGRGDYSSIAIVQRDEQNRIRLVHHESTKGVFLEDQRTRVHELVQEYSIRKMRLDKTGMGIDNYQILSRKYGEYMCEGVNFDPSSKAEMAGRMVTLFQSKQIDLPNDMPLLKDVNSIEKIYSASQNIKFEAQRTDGSHGDRFWSLALACKAAGWTNQGDSIRLLKGASGSKENLNPNYDWEDRSKLNEMKDRVARETKRKKNSLRF